MARLRSDIAYLFSAILVTGLLLSTIHLHEVTKPAGPEYPDTGEKFEKSHLFCPFCSVLFEATMADADSETVLERPSDSYPAFQQRIDSPFHFAAISGRSPPLG